MARDIETVRTFAHLDEQEQKLLTSRQRPIVLLHKRPGSSLSSLVAPGNNFIGVMLPYTPLHVLLFEDKITQHAAHSTSHESRSTQPTASVLVMTSANRSNEPIARENDDVIVGMPDLVDAVLAHNREIHVHCDDSVVRVFEGAELPIRRSRGYAPFPVRLPFQAQPILAVGGELKATFCLTRDDHAFMSQHIGDMENLETLNAFERAVEHFQAIFRVEPQIIACDKHPGYLSTRWAQQHANGRVVVPVQHHHAHIAAVMAEHGLGDGESVIGFSFDGTGYGKDGAIWGGEVMLAGYHNYDRLAHLKYVPLPGGDAAVKRPYRTALAHLWAAGVSWQEGVPPVEACPPLERDVLLHQLETGLNSVDTSSMGRLFDAVAALAGQRQAVTYEAQAAIEFEAQAATGVTQAYGFDIVAGAGPWQFDAAPIMRDVVADFRDGIDCSIIAAKFHNAVADLIETLSLRLSRLTGVNTIALSGGVFQNATLLGLTMQRLRQHDLRVLVHRKVPPNDGGLALGQAVVAHFSV
jgi:hydrogenase maturation protein HypF